MLPSSFILYLDIFIATKTYINSSTKLLRLSPMSLIDGSFGLNKNLSIDHFVTQLAVGGTLEQSSALFFFHFFLSSSAQHLQCVDKPGVAIISCYVAPRYTLGTGVDSMKAQPMDFLASFSCFTVVCHLDRETTVTLETDLVSF